MNLPKAWIPLHLYEAACATYSPVIALLLVFNFPGYDLEGKQADGDYRAKIQVRCHPIQLYLALEGSLLIDVHQHSWKQHYAAYHVVCNELEDNVWGVPRTYVFNVYGPWSCMPYSIPNPIP